MKVNAQSQIVGIFKPKHKTMAFIQFASKDEKQ